MIFKIKKGNHYSNLNLWKLFPFCFGSKDLNFTFKLSKECLFEIKEEDDRDINKIFGRSFGFHHKNSIRLGWVPSKNEGMYELFLYYYNNGVRGIKSLGEYQCDVAYECRWKLLRYVDGIATQIFNDAGTIKSIQYTEFIFPKNKISYYLFPFFGGNKLAARTMKIEINLLK